MRFLFWRRLWGRIKGETHAGLRLFRLSGEHRLAWGISGEEGVELIFCPKCPRIFFERGDWRNSRMWHDMKLFVETKL